MKRRKVPQRPPVDLVIKPGRWCVRLYGHPAVVVPLVRAVTGDRFTAASRLVLVRIEWLPDLLAACEEQRLRYRVPVRRQPDATLFDFGEAA